MLRLGFLGFSFWYKFFVRDALRMRTNTHVAELMISFEFEGAPYPTVLSTKEHEWAML
jgi:hypothetical protein